ncbi:MAG: copper homeostasis protein CutC [Flavobacteriales bacterium]
MGVQVEVCVTSVEEAMVAATLGVDSIEVCSWLACGGLTPSSGLVDAIRNAVRIPVRVLIRPTPTGFVYTDPDVAVLLTDAEVFGGGALSLVAGALDEKGGLHVPIMSAVKRLAPESEITFHRAIDHASDPIQVVDDCIALELDRILTSGGAARAVDGIPMIAQMVQRAKETCVIAVAGGVNADNVLEIVERTGTHEVHFAAQRTTERVGDGPALSSAGPNSWYGTVPDEAKIEAVLNALTKAGLR